MIANPLPALLQMHPDPDLAMMIPVFKLGIVAISCAIITLPIVRAIVRRLDRAPQRPIGGDTDARLARIEQAVDAVAIEVERISEAQRFTTRLLSERMPGSLPSGTAERGR